jgi:putative cardiolipin synthase
VPLSKQHQNTKLKNGKMKRINFKRVIKRFAIGVIGVLLLFYLTFVGLLEITERQWLGKAPASGFTNTRLLEPHQLSLLDVGIDSLATRLKMIEEAQHSIDLEFFIYELDTSSRLISNALARRAREGLKVRVIVDFARPVFKLRPVFARKLQDAGVEIRYYNTAGIQRFFAIQHRTHRKMLIVDNIMAILGGRNIGDDYFDLSHHYNFIDSDIWVKGEIVHSISKSFDLYWNSEWTETPEYAEEPGNDELLSQTEGSKGAVDWLKEKGVDESLKKLLRKRPTLTSIHTCSDIQFITDHPGSGVEKRVVYKAIVELAKEAKQIIRIESPYLVLRQDGLEDFRNVSNSGVSINVLTNSLYSTDAYYTVAALLPMLDDFQKLPGLNLYAYKGMELKQQNGNPQDKAISSTHWGVHAKRAIIDDQILVVGTYNMDPRSANLNSELILVCRGNSDLVGEAITSFELRKNGARLITGTPNPTGKQGLLAGAEKEKIWKTYGIMPFARWFGFLL